MEFDKSSWSDLAAGALAPPIVERAAISEAAAGDLDVVAGRIEARVGRQEAPRAAVQVPRAGPSMPAGAALQAVGRAFRHLKQGEQSLTLRHIFLAERNTGRIVNVPPRSLSEVAVIGGWTMGAGIAAACLLAGLSVVMVERDGEAAAGRGWAEDILRGSLKRGLVSADWHAAIPSEFVASFRYADLMRADLVVGGRHSKTWASRRRSSRGSTRRRRRMPSWRRTPRIRT